MKKADFTPGPVNESRQELPAEKALFQTVQTVEEKLSALPAATDKVSYLARLKTYTAFQAPLETFFKDVMVNDENKDVRNNRLNLLARVRACLTQTGADITQL